MNKEKLKELDFELTFGEHSEATEKGRRIREIEEIQGLGFSIHRMITARGKNMKRMPLENIVVREEKTKVFVAETGIIRCHGLLLSHECDFDFRDKNFTDAIDTLRFLSRLGAISASLTNETIS